MCVNIRDMNTSDSQSLPHKDPAKVQRQHLTRTHMDPQPIWDILLLLMHDCNKFFREVALGKMKQWLEMSLFDNDQNKATHNV